MKEIERFFRPEFINRLDDVIVFRPLTKDNLNQIVELEVAKVANRLAQQGIHLSMDVKAKDFLIDKGYNPDFGARPLRRAVGQFIEDPMSEMLLQGDIKSPCNITVTLKDGPDGKPADNLYFDSQPAPTEPSPSAKPAGKV